MKWLILFVIIVLTMLKPSFKVEAATFKFVWSNTVVDIPVGDELVRYVDKPKARLYRDGMVLADANITYAPQGDWLYFLKDVDTNVVGSYQVWYKAFENDKYRPGTCQGYKCLVIFNVYDDIEPTISIHEEELYRDRGYMHGASKEEIDLDLESNITYNDNYSKSCKVSLSHQISYDIVGKYEVKVNVSDEFGNVARRSFYVTVGEKNLPTISFLGQNNTLRLGLNQEVDIHKYFKAYDHQYGDISSDIVFPTIDTSRVGSYSYTPYLIKDGLRAECEIIIEVIDDVPPELILTTHKIILSYKEDFSTFDFKSYVQGVKDNEPYNEDGLKITYDLENIVGSYHIYYSYTDGIYIDEDFIEVSLISRDRPILEVEDVYLDSSSPLDLAGFITIYDESDPNIYESLAIDDSRVDYTTAGMYYATAYCMNSSGLSATKQFRVIINGGATKSPSNAILYGIIGIISGLLISSIGFISFYFVYKKRNKPI